jgi:hypothetical protein
MSLLSLTARRMLLANARMSARYPAFDPYPLARLFNPLGSGTWLVSELYPDGETLFGLADLGFGCPEPGCFSLREVARIHLPFGRRIERDRAFRTRTRMSRWTEAARLLGSIDAAQAYIAQMERAFGPIPEIPLKRG